MTSEDLKAYVNRLNPECVPAEYAGKFTLVEINPGPFGLGGLPRVPVCNRCGALVYPTALDRHLEMCRKPDGL